MDLFTIRANICLQFLSTPNFTHQQYEAIFKQDDNFQNYYVKWSYARYMKKEKINKKTLNFNLKIQSYLSFPTKLH